MLHLGGKHKVLEKVGRLQEGIKTYIIPKS